MNLFYLFSSSLPAIIDASWWSMLLVKITCLLALAWMLHFSLARTNPRWRVLGWRITVVGLLALVTIDASKLFIIPLTIDTPINVSASASRVTTQPQLGPSIVADTNQVMLRQSFGDRRSLSELPSQTSAIPTNALTDDVATSIPWIAVFVTVWLIGLGLGLIREMIGWRRLHHIVSKSVDAPSNLQELALAISKAMDTKPCLIRISEIVRSPLVCRSSLGWTLLIPSSTLDTSDNSELTAILTHELAHKHSHDLQWNLLIKYVALLLWPHPLVWRIQAAHVRACEYAADAESARRMGDASAYARTLAKVALNVALPDRIPGLAMARISDVRQRLERVQQTFRLLPLSRRQVATFSMLGFAASLGLGAFQLVTADTPESKSSSSRALIVRVLDSVDRQLEDVTILVRINDDDKVIAEKTGDGSYRIAVGDDAEFLQVRASSPNHVPMAAAWLEPELKSELLSEFVFKLPPGTKASGHVMDESNKPVENAEVYLLVITDKTGRQQVDLYRHQVKTDANGFWVCNVMPAIFNDIWIRLVHPEYVSDNMFGDTAGRVSIDDLRAGTHAMVLKKGVSVAGKILGPEGEPIENATVFQGRDRFGSEYPSTKTNVSGEFEFKHSKPGEMVLTIGAQGFAPELKTIMVTPEMKPISIQLVKGAPLKVRILGPDGKPLEGVLVAADTWREHRSLCDLEMPRKTDKDGLFVWNDSPADGVQFDLLAKGYMDQRGVVLKPQAKEHVIKFFRPLQVRGSVTDAITKLPIANFDVVPGIEWNPGGQIHWDRQDKKIGSVGSFQMGFEYPRPGHVIQIEAAGYEPEKSRTIQSNEGNVALEFKLTPTKPLNGFVNMPDGRPAALADVLVAIPNQYVDVFNGRMRDARDNSFAVTKADGSFTVPSQKGPFKLLALHDSGVAIVAGEKFQSGMSLTLSPWSSIKGLVNIGDQAARQTGLHLFDSDPTPWTDPRFTFSGTATSDDQGNFEFLRVPPNREMKVSRIIPRADNGEVYTHSTSVQTKPGNQHQITIGGEGRPVIGNVVIPNGFPKYQWGHCVINPTQTRKNPPGWEEWSDEKQQAHFAAWVKSDEGARFFFQQSKNYVVAIQPDGSFRVDDVVSGKWTLNLPVNAALESKQCGFGEHLGAAVRSFTIPEIAGGQSNEPFEIGIVAMELRKFLNVGDQAPAFTVSNIDGKSISLADFGGKYVLLDFWATWCAPCLAELPNLESAYQQLSAKDNFVIVGLNFDSNLSTVKSYLAEHSYPWTQARVADEDQAKIMSDYGVQGIPATFLIGPDGRVIATGLRGENVVEKIKELLGK